MSLETFSKSQRLVLFEALSEGTLDLLVIGGGITGASVFRDAALRGMRVGLVESNDFASATSERSSKMVHGGLRYLKSLGFRVARKSCKERNLHVRLNGRLVRPMPFLVPLYKHHGPSRLTLRLGMLLYEVLSGFGKSGFGRARRHRFLDRDATIKLAPALPTDGLTGACLYHDAATSDVRLTVETVKDGVRLGGTAINHAPLTRLLKEDGKVVGGAVRDRLTGEEYQVRARAVVNATGVFSDAVRRMDAAQASDGIRLSKGTHLIFDEKDVPLSVTVVFDSPLDGRPLFLAKHEGCFLYGASDDWEDAAPDDPAPAERDVEYLISSLSHLLPEAHLTREKVRFAYSGFRPLPSTGGDSCDATREDRVEVSPSGLISVMGGKLTTARPMAVRALDQVIENIGGYWQPCQTHKRPIGGTSTEIEDSAARWTRRSAELSGYFRVLHERYGVDADGICERAMHLNERGLDPVQAEVEYVCRHEMVCTVEDLIERRAGFLHWSPEDRLERLRYGAEVIRAEVIPRRTLPHRSRIRPAIQLVQTIPLPLAHATRQRTANSQQDPIIRIKERMENALPRDTTSMATSRLTGFFG